MAARTHSTSNLQIDRLNASDMATMATIFTRMGMPRPAWKSESNVPNLGWCISHEWSLSDDRARKNAASKSGPVVGISGRTTPTIPSARKNTPNMKYTGRSHRLV